MRTLPLILAAASFLAAQEFEVASIHTANDDGNQDSDVDQGRYSAHNLALKRLIARAWDVG